MSSAGPPLKDDILVLMLKDQQEITNVIVKTNRLIVTGIYR